MWSFDESGFRMACIRQEVCFAPLYALEAVSTRLIVLHYILIKFKGSVMFYGIADQ